MDSKECIQELVERSRAALKEISRYNQSQVDALIKVMAKAVFDNAEMLARMAVDETRLGDYDHKVAKNRNKACQIWWDLRDKKSVDIIGEDRGKGIVLLAKPKGVIGAVTPTTNPVVTPMSNSMFSVKGRNSVIVAPHPRSKRTTARTVQLMNDAIKKLGAPGDLIQVIEEPTIELTQELMRSVDVIVATGGMPMVRAAYSSGKPAFGVGAGNVQSIIDRDVDIDEAVKKIIMGRTFDNGLICSGEQSVIIPEEKYDEVIRTFVANGAFYAEDQETVEKFRSTIFVNGSSNSKVVGQPVKVIADLAGVQVPEGTRVILMKPMGIGSEDLLCKEKMCPCMIALKYGTFEEAVEIAFTNLMHEGTGHSVTIHSHNRDHIEYAGKMLPISRLVVNQPGQAGAGGNYFNGLAPTTTMGCGSWGNNSISENFTYHHLINVSRIAYYIEDHKVPTMEDLWG